MNAVTISAHMGQMQHHQHPLDPTKTIFGRKLAEGETGQPTDYIDLELTKRSKKDKNKMEKVIEWVPCRKVLGNKEFPIDDSIYVVRPARAED